MNSRFFISPMKLGCVFAAVVAASGWGQLAQDQPRLCGKLTSNVALPLGLSAVQTSGGTNLTIQLADGSKKTLDLLADTIVQVCPIAGDRLLIFGTVNGGDGPFVWIVSESSGDQLDNLGARNPAVSPDQHWIAYRQYYAPQVENPADSNYLLYDLGKTPAENRLPSGDPQAPNPPGRLMYPAAPNHVPVNDYLVEVAPEQEHNFASDSFFWSPDSRFVVFADRMGRETPTTSIIVVRIGGDELTAYVHRLQTQEVCTGEKLGPEFAAGAILSRVEFVPSGGAVPDMFASFSADGWPLGRGQSCTKVLLLNNANLRPAEPEFHKPLLRRGVTQEVPRPR
jgi:hypothetical protein